MKIALCTLGQALVLIVLATGVGLGMNAARERGHIDLSRQYFPPIPPAPPADPGPSSTGATSDANAAPLTGTTETQPVPPPSPFEVVNLAAALALFEHPNAAVGLHVFVDARDDDHYESGHIPGALQCDHYRIDQFLPTVVSIAAAAEKVIVYCNGGECEDSLAVCGDLLQADIPRAKILLFKEGWQAWIQAGLPQAAGREPAP